MSENSHLDYQVKWILIARKNISMQNLCTHNFNFSFSFRQASTAGRASYNALFNGPAHQQTLKLSARAWILALLSRYCVV
jgi:hypothetical protein